MLRKPRIVVADDSGFMRRLLTAALEKVGYEVVGVGKDGDEALDLCERLRPDAMTLDLAMPGKDGIAVLRELRASASPIPVVVVSAFSPADGARAVDALSEGAFELVSKPAAGEPFEGFVKELDEKVRAAVQNRASGGMRRQAPAVVPSKATVAHASPPWRRVEARPPVITAPRKKGKAPLVVIACSTGGPRALADLVPKLPSPLGAGTLIVQHMPAGFTSSLATRLDNASKLHVLEAGDGTAIEPGTALLAPGGTHLRLNGDRRAHLSDEAAIGGLRPRADLTIKDAAERWGNRVVLVVLTGMGRDGLEGARHVKKQGGRVLVEAESSCTVYGMPRAIAEAGLADRVLDLADLPRAIQESV
jgi:two-component system, chemotaxis family, protein-glutamate methylesterase/glutaminase